MDCTRNTSWTNMEPMDRLMFQSPISWMLNTSVTSKSVLLARNSKWSLIQVHPTCGFLHHRVGLLLVGSILLTTVQSLALILEMTLLSKSNMVLEELKAKWVKMMSMLVDWSPNKLLSVKPLHSVELVSLLDKWTVFWDWHSTLSVLTMLNLFSILFIDKSRLPNLVFHSSWLLNLTNKEVNLYSEELILLMLTQNGITSLFWLKTIGWYLWTNCQLKTSQLMTIWLLLLTLAQVWLSVLKLWFLRWLVNCHLK